MFWMNAAWMIGCILGYTMAKDEIYIQMGSAMYGVVDRSRSRPAGE